MFHDGIFPNTQSRIPWVLYGGLAGWGLIVVVVVYTSRKKTTKNKERQRRREEGSKREKRERESKTGLSVIGLRIWNLHSTSGTSGLLFYFVAAVAVAHLSFFSFCCFLFLTVPARETCGGRTTRRWRRTLAGGDVSVTGE
jgi:dipeptide/tripeptide permease